MIIRTTQWPEPPATLHSIGSCILEFSPSNAYVEDWRQQTRYRFILGLRLVKAVHRCHATKFRSMAVSSSAVSIWHMHSRVYIQQNIDALGILSYVDKDLLTNQFKTMKLSFQLRISSFNVQLHNVTQQQLIL